ncbi:hypothetical protein HDC33_000455 [Sporosarcina sp. JAI121]|nr:hypothetical protein [Sporosarcina sp. JAI121]
MLNELKSDLKFKMHTNEEIEDRFYQYLSFASGEDAIRRGVVIAYDKHQFS